MLKKVDDLEGLARQIQEDLKRHYPQASWETYYLEPCPGQATCWHGSLEEAFLSFKKRCRQCTSALVHYDSQHPYGMVLVAYCECETPRPECNRPDARAHVLLTISHDGAKDMLLGRNAPPPAALMPALAPERHP